MYNKDEINNMPFDRIELAKDEFIKKQVKAKIKLFNIGAIFAGLFLANKRINSVHINTTKIHFFKEIYNILLISSSGLLGYETIKEIHKIKDNRQMQKACDAKIMEINTQIKKFDISSSKNR